MKKILLFISIVLLTLTSCKDDYDFNPGFTVPTELSGPKSVALDVTSTVPVVLSWSGGKASDGGIVQYSVLFDKQGGDFSNPTATLPSDLGAEPQLTLTQSQINIIARNAGIKPEQTGTLIWTVVASRGGDVQRCASSSTIEVTRGEGIDNLPSALFLYGSATENGGQGGQQFRKVSDGVFRIYTKLTAGNIEFRSSTSPDAFTYYIDQQNNGKLKEGPGTTTVDGKNDISRITVDFNTMSMIIDNIGSSVRCIWGATFDNIAVLQYKGNGNFSGDGDIRFIQQSRPETNPPSWLSWVEERYYFIAKVNGADTCWGRADDVSAERPVGGEPDSFYALHEFGWSQWDHLWKMKGGLDMTHATITIETNHNDLMIHTFTNTTSIK